MPFSSTTSPLDGTGSNEFTAGEVLEVAWSGGPADGKVKLSLSLNGSDTARDGLGLPNDGKTVVGSLLHTSFALHLPLCNWIFLCFCCNVLT